MTARTYKVTGSTPYAISKSIEVNGPYSRWLRGRAEGLTAARLGLRFVLQPEPDGDCRIVVTAKPAIRFTYVVTLPKWSPPKVRSLSSTIWWNAELLRAATHERHHVEIYRTGQKLLNKTLAGSTCWNVNLRLNRVVQGINRQQCEFDMREYGVAMGLSLKACLAS